MPNRSHISSTTEIAATGGAQGGKAIRDRPVSQYSAEKVGISIYHNGALADPDGGVELGIERERDALVLLRSNTPADRDGVGIYSYQLDSSITAEKGSYVVTWRYSISGVDRQYEGRYDIVDVMDFFDMLNDEEKALVYSIYHKVSDTFDSREGGPYLWEVLQLQFNAFEAIARFMVTDAMDYINYTFQPAFNPPFTVGAGSAHPFPVGWYGMLSKATYVEFLKHLSRSYIEIPAAEGVSVARLNRTRYRQEWQQEAKDEKAILDSMLKQFKRQYLLGTSRSLLLGGGMLPYMFGNPARPHWIYPAARY